MKRFIFYLVLIIVVSATAIYLLNSFGGGINWKRMFDFFFHEWWGLIGLISLLISWMADAAVIYLLTRKGSKMHFGFIKSFKTTVIGAFFGMITPSYSGGQPMQLVYMGKSGLSLGVSTSVMVLRFVVEQTALEFIAFLGVVRAVHLMRGIPAIISLALVGFTISTGMIVFLVLFSLNRRVYNKIFGVFKWFVALFKFSKKLRPKIDSFLDRVDSEVEMYAESAKNLNKDPILLISTFLLGILSNMANFLTVYSAIISTGILKISLSSLFNIVSIQSLATMIIYFSPTPGASGVAEGGFYLFFSPIIPREYLGTVTLEWRMLTYFIPLLIGFLLVLWESFKGINLKADGKNKEK